MKKIILIASVIAVTVSAFAAHYPDSVQYAGSQEPNISYGWNFEFGGGIGVGSYTFKQIGSSYASPYTTNKINFPAGNAGIGINYYFVNWMGLGTGLNFAAYTNRTAVTKPWSETTYDQYSSTHPSSLYTITSTPSNLNEIQSLYMLEVPLALKFRYRPGVVGMTASVGAKLGFPIYNNYKLQPGGTFANQVYYEFFDLLMKNVPGVVEDISIPEASGSLNRSQFHLINYAAHVELGMLIRLQQRVELGITAYGTYYVNDVLVGQSSKALGFANGTTAGEYPMPYTNAYDGVLRTSEVETLHPWAAGIKLTVQVNANRTKAQRDYDREQRRLRKALRDSLNNLQPEPEPEIEPVVEIVEEDTVPFILLPDPREEAIRRILAIADSNGINLCQEFCQIHDTVYRTIHDTIRIYNDPEPTPVIKEDTVAKQLDDMLSEAVIFFDFDKAVPILEPEDILIRLAEVLKRHPNQKIHVNGHACKLGKPDYNLRLALRRAKAVAAQLKELGVRDDQMIVASLGEDMPYRYNGHHQLSKDRRVEIIPTYQTTEIVVPGSRLAQIARRHYGNPDFWVFIYEANKEDIPNPQDLAPGTLLEIPNLSDRLKGMNEEQMMQEAKRLKEEILKK